MKTTTTPQRVKIPIWSTIVEAFRFATKHYQVFFPIALTAVIVQIIIVPIPTNGSKLIAAAVLPLSLLGTFLTLWSTVAIIKAMAKAKESGAAAYKESYSVSLNKIWPYFLNAMLMGFIVMYAALLLIIPGIYLAIIYCFVIYAVILEDPKTVSPFKYSAALVKGYFWTIVLYGLAATLIFLPIVAAIAGPYIYAMMSAKSAQAIQALRDNMVFNIGIYALQALIMPYSIAVQFMLFSKIKEAKQGSPELSDAEALKPKANGCAVVILFIIATVALAAGAYFMFKGYIPHK